MRKISGLLVLCLVLTGCNPFKVTDPNDPKFDITKFDLNDYNSDDEINKVLKIIFPVGTEKQEVDKVLIGNLNLKPTVAWHQFGSMRKEGVGNNYYFISYIGLNTSKNSIHREFITAQYDLKDQLIFNLEYGIISKNKGNENLLLPWLLGN